MAQIQEQENKKNNLDNYIYKKIEEKKNITQSDKLKTYVEKNLNVKIQDKQNITYSIPEEDNLEISDIEEVEIKKINLNEIEKEKNIFDNNYLDVIDQLDDIELKLSVNRIIDRMCKRLNPKGNCFKYWKRKYKRVRNKLIKELSECDDVIEDFIDNLIKLGKRKDKNGFWVKARENTDIALTFIESLKELNI